MKGDLVGNNSTLDNYGRNTLKIVTLWSIGHRFKSDDFHYKWLDQPLNHCQITWSKKKNLLWASCAVNVQINVQF